MFTARLHKVLDVYKKHAFEEIQLFLHRNLTFSERREKQLQELADGGDDLMFWKEYKQNRKFTRVSLCIHTVILTLSLSQNKQVFVTGNVFIASGGCGVCWMADVGVIRYRMPSPHPAE